MKLPLSILCLTGVSFTLMICTICEALNYDIDPLQTNPNELNLQDRLALKQLYELYKGMDAIEKRAPAAGFFGMRGKKVPGNNFFGVRGKKGPSGFLGMRGKKMESRILNFSPDDEISLSLVPLPLQEEYWNHLKPAVSMKEHEALSDNGAGEAAAARLASFNPNLNVNLPGSGDEHSDDKRAPTGFMGLRGK